MKFSQMMKINISGSLNKPEVERTSAGGAGALLLAFTDCDLCFVSPGGLGASLLGCSGSSV